MNKKQQGDQNRVFINFVGEINEKTNHLLIFLLTEQLRSGVSRFRINISSSGGTVFHAVSLFNFLSGLRDVDIHTHNLGQIDSAANLLFLSGTTRTASKASSFLLHPPHMIVQERTQFPLEVLRERLEGLEKDEYKIAEIIGLRLGKEREEILQMFKDRKTYSSAEAKGLGFIQEIEEFVAAPNTPIYTITNQG